METDVYLTKDIGEAAALLSSGIKLLRLQEDTDFYWFVFEKYLANDTSTAYWSGELTIQAIDYYEKLRFLKDRLFAHK